MKGWTDVQCFLRRCPRSANKVADLDDAVNNAPTSSTHVICSQYRTWTTSFLYSDYQITGDGKQNSVTDVSGARE